MCNEEKIPEEGRETRWGGKSVGSLDTQSPCPPVARVLFASSSHFYLSFFPPSFHSRCILLAILYRVILASYFSAFSPSLKISRCFAQDWPRSSVAFSYNFHPSPHTFVNNYHFHTHYHNFTIKKTLWIWLLRVSLTTNVNFDNFRVFLHETS